MDCKSRTPFVAHWSIAEAHSPLHQYTVAATLFLMIFSQNPSCQRLPAQICSTICLCISTLWQFFCRKILGKSFKKKDCVSLEPTIQKARKVTHSHVVICFCIVLTVQQKNVKNSIFLHRTEDQAFVLVFVTKKTECKTLAQVTPSDGKTENDSS